MESLFCILLTIAPETLFHKFCGVSGAINNTACLRCHLRIPKDGASYNFILKVDPSHPIQMLSYPKFLEKRRKLIAGDSEGVIAI